MFAITARRVIDQTSDEVNRRIARMTEMQIAYHLRHPEEINQRLAELDEEWDIERYLETGSAAVSLTGLTMGLLFSRKWLILPLAVQAFFMQHAVQGWCPPLSALRRLGVRTADEINSERYALKAARGDLGDVSESSSSSQSGQSGQRQNRGTDGGQSSNTEEPTAAMAGA